MGIDIKEKKITLPLIYTLNVANPSEKRQIINIIKNHNKNKAKIKELIKLVKDKGGLSFAVDKMEAYRQEAMKILLEFPKNQYRDALELMLNYVIERKI